MTMPYMPSYSCVVWKLITKYEDKHYDPLLATPWWLWGERERMVVEVCVSVCVCVGGGGGGAAFISAFCVVRACAHACEGFKPEGTEATRWRSCRKESKIWADTAAGWGTRSVGWRHTHGPGRRHDFKTTHCFIICQQCNIHTHRHTHNTSQHLELCERADTHHHSLTAAEPDLLHTLIIDNWWIIDACHNTTHITAASAPSISSQPPRRPAQTRPLVPSYLRVDRFAFECHLMLVHRPEQKIMRGCCGMRDPVNPATHRTSRAI